MEDAKVLINQMYWQNVWSSCVDQIKRTRLHQAHTREEEQAFSRRLSKLRHSSFMRYGRPTSRQG